MSTIIEKDLDKYHASIANKILNASYSLSVVEKRLIVLSLSKINSSIEFDRTKWYGCTAAEYAAMAGINVNKARKELADCADSLFNKYITIKEGNNVVIKFHWVDWLKYDKENHTLEFQWSNGLIPFISALEGDFTRLLNKAMMNLDSTYSQRLYDLLEQERFKGLKGVKYVELEELYFMWVVPEGIREFKYFNRDVLKPAIRELEGKKMVKFTEVGYVREGKRVKGIKLGYLLVRR